MKLTQAEKLELADLTCKAQRYRLTDHESARRAFLAAKKLVDPSEYEALREWYEYCLDDLQPYLGGGGDDW